MSKAQSIQIDELLKQNAQIMSELQKERDANTRLTEIAYRKEAQLARQKLCDTRSKNQQWKNNFSNLVFNDFRESAISIFEWDGIPENPYDFFNSKRIESQIFNFAPVCIFEHDVAFPNAATLNTPNPTNKLEKTLLVLPFIPAYPALDCYGEVPVIRPYSMNGDGNMPDRDWIRGDGNPYGAKIVGKDCVVISDFFEWSQTNINTSMCIAQAVRTYAELIAECEIAKKINRNWIKIPLIFNTRGSENNKKIKSVVQQIANILQAIDDYDDAVVTDYAENLEVLDTGIQYFGAELEQTIKDYENKLYNYLGIGHIKNETRARKITAEFEKTSDEYNINITKRLQLREKALRQLKIMFPNYFSNVTIKVNLDGFAGARDPQAETTGERNAE